MSRDYRIVEQTDNGPKFRYGPSSFNMNVWGTEYYGRLFKNLGLPYDLPRYVDGGPSFKHEFKGADLMAVREASCKHDFAENLIRSITQTDLEMETGEQEMTSEQYATWLQKELFALFQNPAAVAVASDYCERYL